MDFGVNESSLLVPLAVEHLLTFVHLHNVVAYHVLDQRVFRTPDDEVLEDLLHLRGR